MTEVETMAQAVKAMAVMEGKYLTFSLANEEYGIGILKVKEIIGMMPIRPVPRTPGFFKGVINLRGKVIPVVDLRLKFGMQEMGYTERTCIIVVEIAGEIGDSQMGIVVDAVCEVLNIKENEIEETPTFGARVDTDYILGMGKMEGGVKILLDIDKVLSRHELEVVSTVKEQSSPESSRARPEETVVPPEEAAAGAEQASAAEQAETMPAQAGA